MATELKDTLNLPKTEFPMRASLVQREPERLRHWDEQGLYRRILEKNRGGPSFILHDGPPFTNADLHLGHALNKTLKDAVLRYKWMRGFDAPFVPGWDSHGLPIEHKVTRQLQDEGRTTYTPLEVREACAAFADRFRRIQEKQFRRLGVLGDWEGAYWTITPKYEERELETLATFVNQGLVYRSKKPVYWSIPFKTALAEAEIEYRDHKAVSIYVKLPLSAAARMQAGLEEEAAVVIWTTTPWTLPANLAVAVHPRVNYVAVRSAHGILILARERLETVASDCKLSELEVVKELTGEELIGLEARHPFIDRHSMIFGAEFVTTESGTGCVHIAPGHGLDDYLLGVKHGLETYCPVNDAGEYDDDGRIPQELAGLSVMEESGSLSPANRGVLKIVAAHGMLIGKQTIEHSYPHCWRSKTPVVFRAVNQWFIALDQTGARQRALEALNSVSFIPHWGANRMRAALENRPDWCISRQRTWGVPIPAFYDDDGNHYLDAGVIRALARKIGRYGSNLWFEKTAAELLENVKLPAGWPAAEKLQTGSDTLDVWIDSGCSHRSVLQNHPALRWPADLYLEGSDQHRGWFQSSLWTAVIADGKAPYKSILTHGFIVKEDGTKLSKSDGAARPLTEWVQQYGADILRLWICSQDYRGDVPVSDAIVNNVANNYRALRNTLRWQLGTLGSFNEGDVLPVGALDPLDQWALARTNRLVADVTRAFDRYEFHIGFQAIIHFINNTLSSTYHDILKDRLYTLAPKHPLRRSAQTAILQIFRTIARLVAPLCPFTADEAWSYFHCETALGDRFIALEDWPEAHQDWDFKEAESAVSTILRFRIDTVNDKLEALRQNKKIGKEIDAVLQVTVPENHDCFGIFQRFQEHLAEWFQVSEVRLESVPPSPAADGPPLITVQARPAAELGYHKCPRSWRWVPELVETPWGRVSPRDAEALQSLSINPETQSSHS